jgi:hypothetical protein
MVGLHIPVFADLGKRQGNVRIPDSTVRAMRDVGRTRTTVQVQALFPQYDPRTVRRILNGERRANVKGIVS